MNKHDAETIIAVATMAALSDSHHDEHELNDIGDAAERLGLPRGAAVDAPMTATLRLLVKDLSGAEAKQTAYEVAVAVCNGRGPANPQEAAFLGELATALKIDTTPTDSAVSAALANPAMNWAPPAIAAAANAVSPIAANTPTVAASTPAPASASADDVNALDTHILDQAMLTAALELLPDRLANIAIVPLQLRLVRHIGQQAGQQTDVNQIKDLAAVFGLGAAAQVMESVIRKAFGGIAGGLLGGMFGGTAGVAAGGAVTFASTYALGHAAKQYYAQGRTLSTADLKALFARFQDEAKTMYPKVQGRIITLAQGTNLSSIMKSVTG